MTTSLLTRDERRNVALFTTSPMNAAIKPHFYRKDSAQGSVLVAERVPVFRSGVFRDSMGDQHTWESIHMQQMVDHFNLLRSNKLFEDVPVRDGHPGFIMSGTPGTGRVVGWHTGLSTVEAENPADGTKQTYLVADFEILDTDAQNAITSGLWRNRSAEVGSYVTNAEAEFWPVYMGVAYVDIGAVEGLKIQGFSKPVENKSFTILHESSKGSKVTVNSDGTQSSQPAGPTGNPAHPGSTEKTQEVAVDQAGEQVEAPGTEETAKADEGVAPAGGAEKSAQHTKTSTTGNFSFAVYGTPTTDFSAVQRHITTLEEFRSETETRNRKDFVASLASANKVLATQVTSLEEFALGLNDTQYASWRATWDAAPASSLLAMHGTNPKQGNSPADDVADEINIVSDIVKMHRNSGMDEEKIKQTESYKRLQALQANQS